jgi:DNA-binding NtrC family response regulator
MKADARSIAVLVIDDDEDVLRAARAVLRRPGVSIEIATHLDEAQVDPSALDVVLLDMNFAPTMRDGLEGLDALDRLRSLDGTLSVVLMTAYAGVPLAVEALKRGGTDFVLKPWRDARLESVVAEAARSTRQRRRGPTETLDEIERALIKAALDRNDGTIARAAQDLGLTRQALYRRMQRHDL